MSNTVVGNQKRQHYNTMALNGVFRPGKTFKDKQSGSHARLISNRRDKATWQAEMRDISSNGRKSITPLQCPVALV